METTPSNDIAIGSRSYDHAVSRSTELIACAKTAWKVEWQLLQQQQQQQQNDPSSPPLPSTPPNFRLSSPNDPPPQSLRMLEDGLTLLRSMEFGLKQLQILVRRRGQTNDPTQEIATLQKQLEQDSHELTEFCEQILKIRRRTQEQRHWELIVQWFQQVADHYSKRLQECLKLRGEILAEQTHQRRKLVDSKTSKRKTNIGNRGLAGAGGVTPLFDSPLFTSSPPPRLGGGGSNKAGPEMSTGRGDGTNRPPPPPPLPLPGVFQTPNGNGSTESIPTAYANNSSIPHQRAVTANAPSSSSSSSSTPTYYGRSVPGDMYRNGSAYGGTNVGYGGGSVYGGGGYGGGTGSFATGMRQRKGGPIDSSSSIPIQEQQEEEEKVHSQIQIRKQKRQTQQRLDEARMAETKLGELGQVFGKMSTLISQQGETLEKIEDDVESALVDVTAGQEELTTLYALKKGNRPLIIKVYAVLIFLICFMRLYKK